MESYQCQHHPMTSSPSSWAVAGDQNSSTSSTLPYYQPKDLILKRGSSSSNGGLKRRPAAASASAGAGTVKLSTDPQSVAARQRRHRISDRFRVLKSLVPGGSKMDTVSMLEEAINYVKFLKAQIWLHQAAIANPNFNEYYPPSPPPHPQHELLVPFHNTTNMLLPTAAAAANEEILGYNFYGTSSTAASLSSSPALPPFPYCSFQAEEM